MSHPETLLLSTPTANIPVHVGWNMDLDGFISRCLAPLSPGRVGLLSDSNVFALHGGPLEEALTRAGCNVSTLVLQPGEATKSLEIASEVYGELCVTGFSRKSVLIALGGGVVGDLTGFIAATFMRGMPYLQIPTSLLALVDSAIGGKTAINHTCAKNLIGVFHHPAAIWADGAYLRTLPPVEFQTAFGEIAKYAATLDAGLYQVLEPAASAGELWRQPERLMEIIRRCLRCKMDVVARDERETGLRKVLNFGHTFGHALETATGHERFRHGQAVGWGIILAQELGVKLGLVEPSWCAASRALVERLVEPPPLNGVDPATVLACLRRDKKNDEGKRFFIFSTAPGQFLFCEDVPEEPIQRILNQFLENHGG